MKYLLLLFFTFQTLVGVGQVTGGESIMQFLRLGRSAQVSAMGGMCVSNPSNDLMLSLVNPALLRPEFHNNLGISNNFYLGSTNYSNVAYAWYNENKDITFSTAIGNMNYGSFQMYNPQGQNTGVGGANDLQVQVSASKKYKSKWNYGGTFRVANSRLINLNSVAIMGDAGLVYYDTANQLYCGMLVKNIGYQITNYSTNSGREPLPFDMQLGISKKFLKAPIRLNMIMHHLYQWDITYDNPIDRANSSIFGIDSSNIKNNNFADKLFRHFNFGADILLGKVLTVVVGYNHQRRRELALYNRQGLSGFSFGANFDLRKIKIYYARNNYNVSGAYNELSAVMDMKELFGLGKKIEEKIW
jgi:hypothetical protein